MSYTGGGGQTTGTSALLKCWIQSQNSVLSRHDTTMGLISFPGEEEGEMGGTKRVIRSVRPLECATIRLSFTGDETSSFMDGWFRDASGFTEKATRRKSMHKNVHSFKFLFICGISNCNCAEETAVEPLAGVVYLPSIIKVLGLTSWQGVVTVIMLSGSFPCNHNDALTHTSLMQTCRMQTTLIHSVK